MLLSPSRADRSRSAFLRALVCCHRAVRQRSGRLRSLARVTASLRVLGCPSLLSELRRNGFHLDLAGPGRRLDPFPFVTSERYLTRNSALRERMRAYLAHRAWESEHRTERYVELVYRGDGLVLWHREVAGATLRLCLEVSEERDRNEGELSVVLRVDGTPCCRVSFSYVPADRFGPCGATCLDEPSGRASLLIARSQILVGRGLERFVEVLPNDSARMYTLAGLSGVATADGFARVRGIHELAQVGYRTDLADGFRRSYSLVWADLPGAVAAADHTAFDAEFPATEDAPTAARNRSRSRRRRRTWDGIRACARTTVEELAR